MILYVDNLSTLGDWKNDLLILQLEVTTPLKGSLKNPTKDHPKLPGKENPLSLYHLYNNHKKRSPTEWPWNTGWATNLAINEVINPYKCPYKWATGVLTPQGWPFFFSIAAVSQGEDFAQQISFTNLRSLRFTDGFNKSLEQILPQKLERLSLGNDFNQILDQTELPNDLESLSFGDEFNQNLDAVNLPGTLEELSFGRRFDQSLVDVRLPDGLKSLTFGSYYNQSLENVHLPLSLKHLTFGDRFNQSLEYVSLPSNLQTLHFGMHFSRNLEGITWPSNLRSFSCGRQYKDSLSLGFVEFRAAFFTKNKFCSPHKQTHHHN